MALDSRTALLIIGSVVWILSIGVIFIGAMRRRICSELVRIIVEGLVAALLAVVWWMVCGVIVKSYAERVMK